MPNQFFSPEGDLENYFITEYWMIDQYIGDTLWTWGRNNEGQLGINDTITRSIPVTTFAGGSNWKQISSGFTHTSGIKTDGTLWVWGQNSYGNLGINDTITRSIPVTTFAGGSDWKQVSNGFNHTAAIKTDGTLWTWGGNSYGGLGINGSTQRNTPVTTFAGGTDWKQVSAGGYHTAAIKTDGSLWVWGQNNDGKLGINNGINRSTPVTTFAGGTNWKQVSCGRYYTSAIKTDGTLWVWGQNSYGNLGINDTITRSIPVTTFAGGTNWKQVSAGFNHTAAIKTDGTLWTWGRNNVGQLGINGSTQRNTPVTTFTGGNNWKQISCGYSYMMTVKTDGTLWGWGRNTYGGIGINDVNARYTPVTTFAGGTNWKQVSAGTYHISAITSGTDPTYFIS